MFGIKALIGIYPAIVLFIGLIALYFFPIRGKRLSETRLKLEALHQQKRIRN
jgi:Na+/melibiose symporter-like transporter